jgi:hypothetical protein
LNRDFQYLLTDDLLEDCSALVRLSVEDVVAESSVDTVKAEPLSLSTDMISDVGAPALFGDLKDSLEILRRLEPSELKVSWRFSSVSGARWSAERLLRLFLAKMCVKTILKNSNSDYDYGGSVGSSKC